MDIQGSSHIDWNLMQHMPLASFSSFKSWPCENKHGWGPFYGPNLELTPCFVAAILAVPSIFAIIFVSWQIWSLRGLPKISNRTSIRTRTVAVLSIVQLALSINSGNAIKSISSSLAVVGFALVSLLSLREKIYSPIPSASLLIFWLLSVAVNTINLYSKHGEHDLKHSIATVNSIAVLLLEWWPQQYEIDARHDNPYDRADIFSKLTFTWMTPLMKKGYQTFLTINDLPHLAADDRADTCYDLFNANWQKEVKRTNGNPSLYRVLLVTFGARYIVGNLCKVVQDTLSFVQPQLLRLLIAFVAEYQFSDDPSLSLTKGYYISIAMFVTSISQTAFLHQYFDRAFGTGMRVKTALSNAIFQKSLVMSSSARAGLSSGSTVNLMSIDAGRIQELFPYGNIIWSGPFQIILCLVSLYKLLGNAMWAGVAVMLICVPLNSSINTRQKKFQKALMEAKDSRTRITSEVLTNIKSIKLFAWEIPLTKNVEFARYNLEMAALKSATGFNCAAICLWWFCPFLVSFATFAIYGWLNEEPLGSELIFPSLAVFNLLNFPLAMLPFFIGNLIEANVAAERITKYLLSDQVREDAVTHLPRQNNLGEEAVVISHGSFNWNKAVTNSPETSSAPIPSTLEDINLSVKKGELICVVGKVAAGKSSLLNAVLGEMVPKTSGSVRVHGTVAYASQNPWIFNGTVRENVLFGMKYDEVIYNDTVRACALLSDFSVLPDGDATLVGEKGISLSGGQKARISLARAVYARADVYLLDDPLSAVDEHVGRHIIDNVLGENGLLSSKAILLATNSLPVLRHAAEIYLLENGKIAEKGAYNQIIESQHPAHLYELLQTFRSTTTSSEEPSAAPSRASSIKGENSPSVPASRRNSVRRASAAAWEVLPPSEARKEHVEQGKVSWNVYKEYASVCGPTMMIISLVVLAIGGSIRTSTNVWLKYWADQTATNPGAHTTSYYLGVYGLIGVAASLIICVQILVFYFGTAFPGATALHDRMLNSVLRAPMSFFETTPLGRIVNRFSNDVYKVDQQLPRALYQLANTLISVAFTIIVISFSTPAFLLVAACLSVVYYYYQRYYLATSRELKRLESVSKSPIYAQFQETLDGVTTVRAYNQAGRFNYVNQCYVDTNNEAYFPSISANRWLAVRLEFIGSIMICSAACFSVYSLPSGVISAGSIGLALSYALNITQTLNWTVRMSVEVETNIVSVERIMEYCDLTPEAPAIVEDERPQLDWPDHGSIKFDNYSTRYRAELPLVLRDINLHINAGEKLGIVGRTGAGKSSLSLALFRLIEPAGGHIDIDAVNTSKIGLFDLRSHLSIIPQDSQLFEGTIRSNLDPAERHTDEEIWRVLDLSHLRKHVDLMPGKLDAKITEGGSNLSGGQRQLISLARAMLTETNVLVLDEATAAVDVQTDGLIQNTIRNEFKNRTILTIAHRINTIMDSDRILVLNYGEVAEIGTPAELLKKKDGLFYSLAKEGGLVE